MPLHDFAHALDDALAVGEFSLSQDEPVEPSHAAEEDAAQIEGINQFEFIRGERMELLIGLQGASALDAGVGKEAAEQARLEAALLAKNAKRPQP